jgi:hypothetical protein
MKKSSFLLIVALILAVQGADAQSTYGGPGKYGGKSKLGYGYPVAPGPSCSPNNGSGNTTSVSCTLVIPGSGLTHTLVIFVYGTGAHPYSSSTIGCGTASFIRTTTIGSIIGSTIYAPNVSNGSCPITVTVTGNNAYLGMEAVDIEGANVSAPIDNASCTSTPYCSGVGTGGTASSGSLISTNANEYILGFQHNGGACTYTPNSPFLILSATYPTLSGVSIGPASTHFTGTWALASGSGCQWQTQLVALTQ